jgi:hypothetical protein
MAVTTGYPVSDIKQLLCIRLFNFLLFLMLSTDLLLHITDINFAKKTINSQVTTLLIDSSYALKGLRR